MGGLCLKLIEDVEKLVVGCTCRRVGMLVGVMEVGSSEQPSLLNPSHANVRLLQAPKKQPNWFN